MRVSIKVVSVALSLLGVLLLSDVQQLRAQSPVWTQIPLPNPSECSSTPNGASSPSNCDWGSVSEQIGSGYSATLLNPGVNNPSNVSGAYISGCTYLDGTPGYYSSTQDLWQIASQYDIFPGQACNTGPLFSISSDQIYYWESGYGLEFNGSFTGSTNDGAAGIFFTDSQFTQAGREYGVGYVFETSALSLYWSIDTNCYNNVCWTGYDSEPGMQMATGSVVTEIEDQCTINTNSNNGPAINPSTDYIYDIYFTSVSGTTMVNCIIKSASSETALTTNYFLSKSGFTFNASTGIFSGPVESWYPAPIGDNTAAGAGWYTATLHPTITASPSGNATLNMNWLKVAK
jgi:hypothetical protein